MTRLRGALFVAVMVSIAGRALGGEDGGVVQPETADAGRERARDAAPRASAAGSERAPSASAPRSDAKKDAEAQPARRAGEGEAPAKNRSAAQAKPVEPTRAQSRCWRRCQERNHHTDCMDADGHMTACPCHCP